MTSPALAEKGLEAAKRYAGIAPAAPPRPTHAVAHLHTCRRLERVDRVRTRVRTRGESRQGISDDQLHAMDYMVYAYLQLAQDRKAQDVVAEMNAVPGVNPDRFVGPYALAVSPARYVVERGDWKSAANLPVRSSKFAYADAMTHFARALGAARIGKSRGGQG